MSDLISTLIGTCCICQSHCFLFIKINVQNGAIYAPLVLDSPYASGRRSTGVYLSSLPVSQSLNNHT